MKKQMTPLRDLTLLDRFLFSEAVEDTEFLADALSIIIGEDIVLKHPPQTEKELRSSELRKYIKLDVFAEDERGHIYDAEVQKQNTGNLPKRSRYYQALTDFKLLEIGDAQYGKMNRVHIIMIGPFDLFGRNRYMYTFRMNCVEEPDLHLDDGAYRIFLNTQGTDEDNISPELKALLEFFENPSEEVAAKSGSERIKRMQRRVKSLKESEELGAKYMREWEEKVYARQEGREEGLEEGREEGRAEGLEEGKKQLAALIQILLKEGRIEELSKVSESTEYMEKLLKEYNL